MVGDRATRVRSACGVSMRVRKMGFRQRRHPVSAFSMTFTYSCRGTLGFTEVLAGSSYVSTRWLCSALLGWASSRVASEPIGTPYPRTS